MQQNLPTIVGFWYGSDLTWIEALCIKSFLDHGHRFILYLPHEVSGVPAGTEVRPASEILWPPPFNLEEHERLRVAVFSDLFRLKLCQKTNFIWVDLDAFCVKAFNFVSPWVFGHSQTGEIPNGVLRLPNHSDTLASMLEFVTSPNPTQPWRGARLKRINQSRIANGETWGIEALPWGCSGPKALSHFLRLTGEDEHAQDPNAFYPLAHDEMWKLHSPKVSNSEIERDGVYSVHIYGHQKKTLAQQHSGLPLPGSYLDRMCERHGIEPAEYPIIPLRWMTTVKV